MKLIKILLVLVVLFLLTGVLVGGYFGFVPGVSALFGANTPKDLGVAYSQQASESGLKKTKVTVKTLPESSTKTVEYKGSHAVKAAFDQSELTAAAQNEEAWSDYPIHSVQVKINDDGSCEVSGVLELASVGGYLQAMGMDQSAYQELLKATKIPVSDMTFYAKGTGTAKDGQLNVAISAVEFGRFNVPTEMINKYQGYLVDFAENLMTQVPGFSVNEAKFVDGTLYFDGTLPDSESHR